MLLEYDDNLDATRSTEQSTVQIIVFPCWVNRRVSPFSTHVNIRALRKNIKQWNRWRLIEQLHCYEQIEIIKTCAYSFTCTVPGRGKSHTVFLDRLKISIVSELKYPRSALCIEAPEYTINTRASVSLAPSQENKKRSLMFGLNLHIFSPNFTLLCW